MRLPEGDRLQDAIDMWHDDSWSGCPGGKPVVADVQMPYVLAVLEPWFRQGLSPKRATPKQKVQNRPAPKVDKGSEHRGRRLVGVRSGGLCEVEVGGVCTGVAREWQHRKNRSQQGTWHASNGLHACSPCHAWIHANPRTAVFNGWMVPSWAEPAEVAVLRRGVLVLLTDDGSFEPYEGKVA